MYIDRPLKEYLNDLAAKKPAPGGGSAAALMAATGTSLMSMVANFTIGKPEYKEIEGKIAGILVETVKFDPEFRALIDRDVEAFKKLSAALKSRASGDAGLEELYKAAADAPFLVCEMAGKCMKLCQSLAECGNKNLITDTAVAAVLFEAAFLSARFNVYINLKYIKDTEYIAKIHNVLTGLDEEMPKLKEEILEICEDAIS